jgi:hypothetical protein
VLSPQNGPPFEGIQGGVFSLSFFAEPGLRLCDSPPETAHGLAASLVLFPSFRKLALKFTPENTSPYAPAYGTTALSGIPISSSQQKPPLPSARICLSPVPWGKLKGGLLLRFCHSGNSTHLRSPPLVIPATHAPSSTTPHPPGCGSPFPRISFRKLAGVFGSKLSGIPLLQVSLSPSPNTIT